MAFTKNLRIINVKIKIKEVCYITKDESQDDITINSSRDVDVTYSDRLVAMSLDVLNIALVPQIRN